MFFRAFAYYLENFTIKTKFQTHTLSSSHTYRLLSHYLSYLTHCPSSLHSVLFLFPTTPSVQHSPLLLSLAYCLLVHYLTQHTLFLTHSPSLQSPSPCSALSLSLPPITHKSLSLSPLSSLLSPMLSPFSTLLFPIPLSPLLSSLLSPLSYHSLSYLSLLSLSPISLSYHSLLSHSLLSHLLSHSLRLPLARAQPHTHSQVI